MLTKEQMVGAMDEWLSTEGLHPAEINFIEELRARAAISEPVFFGTAKMFRQAMPDVVASAIMKARAQGKCKEWPGA